MVCRRIRMVILTSCFDSDYCRVYREEYKCTGKMDALFMKRIRKSFDCSHLSGFVEHFIETVNGYAEIGSGQLDLKDRVTVDKLWFGFMLMVYIAMVNIGSEKLDAEAHKSINLLLREFILTGDEEQDTSNPLSALQGLGWILFGSLRQEVCGVCVCVICYISEPKVYYRGVV